MGYLTSGNVIVDAMGSINITGNIIPTIWYRTITKENGKPYLLAIVILADIVYWYRPSEVRDQGTGHILGWKKKFSEDILRQSYHYYAELFGESKKTVKTAMDKLEKLQVIRREFRTVSYGDGLVCNNVMYVELKPDILYQLTFPEKMPAMSGLDDSCAGASDDNTGNTLLPKTDTGLSKKGGTNSYTSANISDRESHHINQSGMETEKAEQGKPDNDMIDVMDEANAYMEIIKENIEYEHYMKYGDWSDKGLYEELYEVICEIVCVKRKTVKVNGEDYPYELVKSKFLKLNSSHLEYVIDCMRDTTTKITNIRAYMVTTLYNASNTMNHYYQQLVQHDMYGGGWEEKGLLQSKTEGDG